MLKYVILLMLMLLLSLGGHGAYRAMNSDFLQHPNKYDGKELAFAGEITALKKIILARDNYYSFHLKVAPKKWVKVRYYSIVDLQQVNSFYCQEGYWTTFKGVFKYKESSKKFLGEIAIKEKSLMLCTPRSRPKKGPNKSGE